MVTINGGNNKGPHVQVASSREECHSREGLLEDMLDMIVWLSGCQTRPHIADLDAGGMLASSRADFLFVYGWE